MKKWTDWQISDFLLYKNNQLIAFNKPAGLPVQSGRDNDKALIDLAEIYVKHPLNLIHRIDRPASGVVLFAQKKSAAAELGNQFQNRTVKKYYLAVTAERPPEAEGQLRHFLHKDGRRNISLASEKPVPGSKEALLNYRYRDSIDHYHLLEIELLTGRHHQVRAQLAAIGCPIKGDVKYGAKRGNRDRSIHLHAWKLEFHHPVSGKPETITAPVPADPVWEAFGIND